MPTDRQSALDQYARMAALYDRGGVRFKPLRRRAVRLLGLNRGEVVLDVGCGTGLSLALILEPIGPEGRIFGIDQSPEMLDQAREKIEQYGWRNVELIESAVEDAAIPVQADAALFALSHDIIRNQKALENVVRHLKPGSRIAVVGVKWAPWWALPVNLRLWWTCRGGMTTYEGLGRPWSRLERLVPTLKVVGRVFVGWHGEYYLAAGHS